MPRYSLLLVLLSFCAQQSASEINVDLSISALDTPSCVTQVDSSNVNVRPYGYANLGSGLPGKAQYDGALEFSFRSTDVVVEPGMVFTFSLPSYTSSVSGLPAFFPMAVESVNDIGTSKSESKCYFSFSTDNRTPVLAQRFFGDIDTHMDGDTLLCMGPILSNMASTMYMKDGFVTLNITIGVEVNRTPYVTGDCTTRQFYYNVLCDGLRFPLDYQSRRQDLHSQVLVPLKPEVSACAKLYVDNRMLAVEIPLKATNAEVVFVQDIGLAAQGSPSSTLKNTVFGPTVQSRQLTHIVGVPTSNYMVYRYDWKGASRTVELPVGYHLSVRYPKYLSTDTDESKSSCQFVIDDTLQPTETDKLELDNAIYKLIRPISREHQELFGRAVKQDDNHFYGLQCGFTTTIESNTVFSKDVMVKMNQPFALQVSVVAINQFFSLKDRLNVTKFRFVTYPNALYLSPVPNTILLSPTLAVSAKGPGSIGEMTVRGRFLLSRTPVAITLELVKGIFPRNPSAVSCRMVNNAPGSAAQTYNFVPIFPEVNGMKMTFSIDASSLTNYQGSLYDLTFTCSNIRAPIGFEGVSSGHKIFAMADGELISQSDLTVRNPSATSETGDTANYLSWNAVSGDLLMFIAPIDYTLTNVHRVIITKPETSEYFTLPDTTTVTVTRAATCDGPFTTLMIISNFAFGTSVGIVPVGQTVAKTECICFRFTAITNIRPFNLPGQQLQLQIINNDKEIEHIAPALFKFSPVATTMQGSSTYGSVTGPQVSTTAEYSVTPTVDFVVPVSTIGKVFIQHFASKTVDPQCTVKLGDAAPRSITWVKSYTMDVPTTNTVFVSEVSSTALDMILSEFIVPGAFSFTSGVPFVVACANVKTPSYSGAAVGIRLYTGVQTYYAVRCASTVLYTSYPTVPSPIVMYNSSTADMLQMNITAHQYVTRGTVIELIGLREVNLGLSLPTIADVSNPTFTHKNFSPACFQGARALLSVSRYRNSTHDSVFVFPYFDATNTDVVQIVCYPTIGEPSSTPATYYNLYIAFLLTDPMEFSRYPNYDQLYTKRDTIKHYMTPIAPSTMMVAPVSHTWMYYPPASSNVVLQGRMSSTLTRPYQRSTSTFTLDVLYQSLMDLNPAYPKTGFVMLNGRNSISSTNYKAVREISTSPTNIKLDGASTRTLDMFSTEGRYVKYEHENRDWSVILRTDWVVLQLLGLTMAPLKNNLQYIFNHECWPAREFSSSIVNVQYHLVPTQFYTKARLVSPSYHIAPIGVEIPAQTQFTHTNFNSVLQARLDDVEFVDGYASYSGYFDWLSPFAIFKIHVGYINVHVRPDDFLVIDVPPGSIYARLSDDDQARYDPASYSEFETIARTNAKDAIKCTITRNFVGYNGEALSVFTSLITTDVSINRNGFGHSEDKTTFKLAVGTITVKIPAGYESFYDSSMTVDCTGSIVTLPTKEKLTELKAKQLMVHVDIMTIDPLTNKVVVIGTTRNSIVRYTEYGAAGSGLPLIVDNLPEATMALKRIYTPGNVVYGDIETVKEGEGTVYVQSDLPVFPGLVLPKESKIEFTLPAVAGSAGRAHSYMRFNESVPLQCYISASYINPDKYNVFPLRTRFYKNTMAPSTNVASVLTNLRSTVTYDANANFIFFQIITNEAWTVPAFFGTHQYEGTTLLSPTLETLCVSIAYPPELVPRNSVMSIRAVTPQGNYYFSSSSVDFFGTQLRRRSRVEDITVEMALQSSVRYHVGYVDFKLRGIDFDLERDTFVELFLPDSHIFEFKKTNDHSFFPYNQSYCTANNQANSVQLISASYHSSIATPPISTSSDAPVVVPGLNRIKMQIQVPLAQSDYFNSDFETMDLVLRCYNVRNPGSVPSNTLARIVMYDKTYNTLITTKDKDVFSGYIEGVNAPITPIWNLTMLSIVDSPWGLTSTKLEARIMSVQSQKLSEYNSLTVSVTPMTLPLSSRSVIDFRLPESWKLLEIGPTHYLANTTCRASQNNGVSHDAEVSGMAVFNSSTKRITFYPQSHIMSDLAGTFRLFCENIQIPVIPELGNMVTVRAYETMQPFNFVRATVPSTTTLQTYKYPTRQAYLSANATVPPINNNYSPTMVAVHAFEYERLFVLKMIELERARKFYVDVLYSPEVNTDGLYFTVKLYDNWIKSTPKPVTDTGEIEYDLTLVVSMMLVPSSDVSAYALQNLLKRAMPTLLTASQKALGLFIIQNGQPTVVELPGQCLSNTFVNDGNMADSGCGRGCGRCSVGAACFDHGDCISKICSLNVEGSSTFSPILYEANYTPRYASRGVCIENASGSVSNSNNSAVLSQMCLLTALILAAALFII